MIFINRVPAKQSMRGDVGVGIGIKRLESRSKVG